jgi:predicted Zn-ribbon and HTH transcriptional regulator
MYRKDLMRLLLERPWTLGELARHLEEDARRLEDDVQHLLRSLRRGDTKVRIEPAECRKCQFQFRADSLLKPSKCPKCRGTWIFEARLSLHAKGGASAASDALEGGPAEP